MDLGYTIAFLAVATAAIVGRHYAYRLYNFAYMRYKLRGTIDTETLKALGIDAD
jgi:hypothetical protein